MTSAPSTPPLITPRALLREVGRLLRPNWPVVAAVTAVGVAGGFATAGLLAAVNRGLHMEGGVTVGLLLRFAALCALVLGGRVIAGIGNSTVGQSLIARMRKDISARVLAVPLPAIERFGAHRILAVLNDDIDNVSAFTFNISGYCISAAVATGCLAYLAILSPALFPIAVFALGIGLWLNFATRKRWNGYYAKVRVAQDELQKQYRAVVDGAKELRLNRERLHRVHGQALSKAAEDIASLKVRAMRLYWSADAVGSTLFFLAIGALLVLKGTLEIDPTTMSGFVITLLFVKGPIDQILTGLPMAGLAMVSLGRIAALTEMLEGQPVDPGRPAAPPSFDSIVLDGVCFEFPGESRFVLGPADLSIRRGETVFLVGENGSGKTTLVKLLLGLYAPSAGRVLLDGQPPDRDAYAALFSAVFSDYFLFEELPNGSPEAIERAGFYLERLEIAHKVTIRDGAFSTTSLSTGQRKRLALIHAYLEDRPVMVFDEWAADQDPTFRKVFYTELLPELKRRGKTLIVVSHDDRYFGAADRVLRLHEGTLVDEDMALQAAGGTG